MISPSSLTTSTSDNKNQNPVNPRKPDLHGLCYLQVKSEYSGRVSEKPVISGKRSSIGEYQESTDLVDEEGEVHQIHLTPGEWVLVLKDSKLEKSSLRIQKKSSLGSLETIVIPLSVMELEDARSNYYFGILKILIEQPRILKAMLSGLCNMKLGEILQSKNLLFPALKSLFDDEIKSSSVERGTLFRSFTPPVILCSMIYTDSESIVYKRNFVFFMIEQILDQIKGKGNSILSLDSGKKESEDFYVFILEAGLNYLLTAPLPDGLITIFKALNLSISEARIPEFYGRSLFFLRIIAPSLTQATDLEVRYQETQSLSSICKRSSVNYGSRRSEKLTTSRESIVKLEKSQPGLSGDPTVNKRESAMDVLGSSSPNLSKIDRVLGMSDPAEVERSRSKSERGPTRSTGSSSDKRGSVIVRKISRTSGELHIDLNSLKKIPKSTSPPSPPKLEDTHKDGKGSSGKLFSGIFTPRSSSSEKLSPIDKSSSSSGELGVLSPRVFRKESPKVKNAFQDPVVLKSLSVISKIYLQLANDLTPNQESPFSHIVSRLDYLKPIMALIMDRFSSGSVSNQPDHDQDYDYEMGEIYSSIMKICMDKHSSGFEEEYKHFMKCYGPFYDHDSVARVSSYIKSRLLKELTLSDLTL